MRNRRKYAHDADRRLTPGAMLWMSVATGIFIVWHGVGALALLYTAIFICIPRAYLGYHYPTDLLAGAAIGIAITYVMTRDAVRTRYLNWRY
jgi:membrane-associated phospholipid phosphatase